ncbi:MAG: hypothetical protein OEQ53_06715, partial [Saprospiraceae bacterium]|nr:hypothetical protein [Saprospiraceae bacterium]
SITHGLLNLAFMASIFFLLTPHWYIRKIITMRVWLGIAILLFVLNYFTNLFNYVPALSFFEKFELPNYLFHLIGIFFGSVTIILCLIFLVNFYYRLRENRTNRLYIFSAVGLFLLAATIFKVDYIFSSRYALQALPFVMIMGAYYGSDKQWAHLIRYAGILIGFVMYFSFRNI